jgi:hypothetical protein
LTIAFLFNYPQKNSTRLPEDYAHGRYLSNRPKDIVLVDANEIDPDKRNQQVRLPADPRASEENAVTIFVAYKLASAMESFLCINLNIVLRTIIALGHYVFPFIPSEGRIQTKYR